MSQYINEAFKQFRMLNESEDFSLDPMGLDNLNSFMDRAMEDEDDDLEIDIIDPETTDQDELKQSYIGKVICDCNVCHSNVFYNKEDITFDEDGVVNVEDECPYCMSNDGYTIVGEIKPYEEISIEDIDEPDGDVDREVDVDEPETDEPIEGEQDTILDVKYDMEEGLQLSGEKELKGTSDLRHRDDKEGSDKIRGKNNTKLSGDLDLHESKDNSLEEDVDHISLDVDDSTIDIENKEDGGVVVETSPTEEEIIDEPVSDDEMIAPLDDETADELGLEDETPEEDTFDFDETESEEEPDEDTEDVDIDEFDEDSFDDLGESYLRRCYENVNGFRTTKVTCNESQIMIEVNISFKRKKIKKTNFIFEAKEVNNGK